MPTRGWPETNQRPARVTWMQTNTFLPSIPKVVRVEIPEMLSVLSCHWFFSMVFITHQSKKVNFALAPGKIFWGF